MKKLPIRDITENDTSVLLHLPGHNVPFSPSTHPRLPSPQIGQIIEVNLSDDLTTCDYYYLGVLIYTWKNEDQHLIPTGQWVSLGNVASDPNTVYDTVNTEVSSTPIMDFSRGEISPTDATDILPDDGVTTLDDLMKEKHDDTPLVGVKFKYTW